MPISIECPSCGQMLKAKESLSGRRLPCPKCGEKILVPEAGDGDAAYAFQEPAPSPPPKPAPPAVRESAIEDKPTRPIRAEKPRASVGTLPPLMSDETPGWLKYFHWLLVLALIPLACSLLQDDEGKNTSLSRLEETLEQATPEEQERALRALADARNGQGTIDTFFYSLPEQRFAGAFLARDSASHWLLALGSAVLFMAFFLSLSVRKTAQPVHLLALGLFTATVGIMLLLALQAVAEKSQGVWLHGRGFVMILFYIVKFIGYSYQAADDPENGFFLSFVGFTLGVGFCEEVVKALPLLIRYRKANDQDWHGAFLWGLASGAGFGIAEGIMYSSHYYNGIHGPGIYVVRFISCVALHALWTGSVAITINQRQELLRQPTAWYEFIPPLFIVTAVPMVLHGLYDTLLKKEMSAWALLVAVLSFLFLAFQISRLRGADDEASRKALLQEYQRRRKLMA